MPTLLSHITARPPSPRPRSGARSPIAKACLASSAALALSSGLFLPLPRPALAAAPALSGGEVAQLEAGLHHQAAGLCYELYQVRAGDTVENIAARFGVRATQVRALNRLSPPAQPEPGHSLAIPLPTSLAPKPTHQTEQPLSRTLPPRYATVTAPAPITDKPTGSPAAEVLYHPDLGAQLIVTGEQGDCWGVVMVDGSTGWIPKSALQLTDQTLSPDTLHTMLQGGRPDIVQEAFRYLGTPYRYGGHLPYSLDCSLLVQRTFAARGLRLPRTADAQFDLGRPVNHSELLPGDRLYFISKSGRINHTGIYIGGGRFIHASSRRGRVAVDTLSDPIYWTRFAGARRS